MKNNKYDISVITLTKNNPYELKKTLNNICYQKFRELIEILVIDGSDFEVFKLNKDFIKIKKNKIKKTIFINHINARENKAFGIYKSMNLGIKKSLGKFIIFMNSGDEFYNKKSILELYNGIKSLDEKSSFCFGQAEMISEIGISWLVPGRNIRNIKKWLRFMLPIHQSIIVSRYVASKTRFKEDCFISADQLWKKEILISAKKFSFIKQPVAKFYIGGLSTSRPNFNRLKVHLKNKYISKIVKLKLIIKFMIPKPLFKYLTILQKFKLKIIENIIIRII